ncbi:MAG TPA: SDR family NAD(P)-dependent oxidoreductase [Kofleriaceae bacterium]|nr:SDR family NAD(P)-dependent oxidoreductase [Kofleriaceae bacterium]
MDIVVTGGTGALGAGVVELFLSRGATVHLPMMEAALPAHLPWREHERVKATPGISLDDEAQVTSFYASLPALWASIHLVGGFSMAKLAETTLADFERQWRMNTVTCFLTCREAVKAMRRTGSAGGRIVNVAARPAITPTAGMISYVASKAGVAALTQSLAPELVSEGILINAVLPSTIDTPANRKSMPNADHASWPKPAQIAETIAFLASAENALTTGTLIPVFGRA